MSTQVEFKMSLANENWVAESVPVVLAEMRGREWTADDLHGLVPEPFSQNAWGLLLRSMKRHIQLVGYRKSERPESRGHLLRIWRVRE